MSVAEVLEYATGKSQLYDTLREGIVFRSLDGKQSFKAVSPEFLIKHNEQQKIAKKHTIYGGCVNNNYTIYSVSIKSRIY